MKIYPSKETIHIENLAAFDFELSPAEMETILILDTKTSAFFDHRDPAMVKRLSRVKLSI